MSVSGGRSPRRDMKAGKGFGVSPRASLGRSRGSRPSPQIRSVPVLVNAEHSSPSSKTPLFTGSGPESSWMTARSSTQSPSIARSTRSSRNRWSMKSCAHCRRIRLVSSASGCRGRVDHKPHTGQRRAGSRGIGKPSRVRPARST